MNRINAFYIKSCIEINALSERREYRVVEERTGFAGLIFNCYPLWTGTDISQCRKRIETNVQLYIYIYVCSLANEAEKVTMLDDERTEAQ